MGERQRPKRDAAQTSRPGRQAPSEATSASQEAMLNLQRTAGNAAVARLMRQQMAGRPLARSFWDMPWWEDFGTMVPEGLGGTASKGETYTGSGGSKASKSETYTGSGGSKASKSETYTGSGGSKASKSETYTGSGGSKASKSETYTGSGGSKASKSETYTGSGGSKQSNDSKSVYLEEDWKQKKMLGRVANEVAKGLPRYTLGD